jgi:hypothetical protein
LNERRLDFYVVLFAQKTKKNNRKMFCKTLICLKAKTRRRFSRNYSRSFLDFLFESGKFSENISKQIIMQHLWNNLTFKTSKIINLNLKSKSMRTWTNIWILNPVKQFKLQWVCKILKVLWVFITFRTFVLKCFQIHTIIFFFLLLTIISFAEFIVVQSLCLNFTFAV